MLKTGPRIAYILFRNFESAAGSDLYFKVAHEQDFSSAGEVAEAAESGISSSWYQQKMGYCKNGRLAGRKKDCY